MGECWFSAVQSELTVTEFSFSPHHVDAVNSVKIKTDLKHSRSSSSHFPSVGQFRRVCQGEVSSSVSSSSSLMETALKMFLICRANLMLQSHCGDATAEQRDQLGVLAAPLMSQCSTNTSKSTSTVQ